jgi:cell division protein FtsQ
MLKFKFNIKREIKIAGAVLVLGFLIAFSERRRSGVAVQDVQIKIENIGDNHFVNEGDVVNLMKLSQENLRGANVNELNLRELEGRIQTERFVEDADIYSDLKGNLVVKVSLRRPLARMVRNDGPDGYIAGDGVVMPTSEKFTSRVVLISGSYVRKLLEQQNIFENELGNGLMEMLRIIHEDEFLHAQIAELDIDSKGKITIYPQVGGQLIEFGKPENLEVKFRKLRIFYKEILPMRGWNTYKRVNLEYEGQIIAE